MSEFHSKLTEYIKTKQLINANNLIMRELGKCLAKNKNEFVDLLVYSGLSASTDMTDQQLIDIFINSIDKNEKLMIGSAYLVNKNNLVSSFDGESEVSDIGVKRTIQIIHNYFDEPPEILEPDPNEEFYSTSEGFSLGSGGVVGAIATAVGESAKLGSTIAQGQQKKKYGALDIATKKMEAKNTLIQSLVAQKQAEAELKKKETEEKTKKIKIISLVGFGIIAIGIVAYVIYKKNKASAK